MKYLDTNVLLRLFDLDDPRNPEVVMALDCITTGNDERFVCGQVMIEYWVSATRPREANGLGVDPEMADDNLTKTQALFACLSETPDVIARWRSLVKQYRVCGKQAHDARIAALMFAHGITHILTLNSSDFARYDGITPITPQQLLGQSGT